MSPATGGGWDTGKVPLNICPDPSAHERATPQPEAVVDTETCPTCWQPVPVPQRGDHDYGIPLRAAQPEAAGEAGLREALDVERLAEAEYNVDQGNQFDVMADALDWAKEVAAEYDRLAATALPEPGERP